MLWTYATLLLAWSGPVAHGLAPLPRAAALLRIPELVTEAAVLPGGGSREPAPRWDGEPRRELDAAAKRSAGERLARPRVPPAARARQKEQQLFRHRFLVCPDLVIRLPLDGIKVLRNLVKRREASGIVHTQVEAFRPRHKLRLSADASRMLMLGNAGGSSLQSEVIAFEVLARSFGAQLEMTEMELRYTKESKITDFAVTLFGEHPIGVSVTRAMSWPHFDLEPEDAYRLLHKKLDAIQISSRNVLNMEWHKQILNVYARSYRDAQLLEEQYARIPTDVRGNSVVVITLCQGMPWIW